MTTEEYIKLLSQVLNKNTDTSFSYWEDELGNWTDNTQAVKYPREDATEVPDWARRDGAIIVESEVVRGNLTKQIDKGHES